MVQLAWLVMNNCYSGDLTATHASLLYHWEISIWYNVNDIWLIEDRVQLKISEQINTNQINQNEALNWIGENCSLTPTDSS